MVAGFCRLQPEEDGFHQPGCGQRRRGADQGPRQDHLGAVQQDEMQHGCSAGAEGEADAHLGGPPRDPECDHAVEPDRRQQERDGAEGRRDDRQASLHRQLLRNLLAIRADPHHRERGLELVNHPGDLTGEARAIAGGRQHEGGPDGQLLLRLGEKGDRLFAAADPGVPGVADDAHDLEFLGLGLDVQGDEAAERRRPGQVFIDEGAVDHRRLRRAGAVSLVEVAAGDERDGERPMEPGRDPQQVAGESAFRRARYPDARVPAEVVEQRERRPGHGAHIRQAPQARGQPPGGCGLLLGAVAGGRRVEAEQHEAVGLEAEGHGLQVGEAAHEQAGHHEQQQRERDLHADQGASHAQAVRPPGPDGGAGLQRAGHAGARQADGGHQADGEPREDRQSESEACRAPSEAEIEHEGLALGGERQDGVGEPAREEQAGRSAEQRQQQALGQVLPHEPEGPRPQREPHGRLAAPGFRAREQQVRHVGAGDQQDEPHERTEDADRPPGLVVLEPVPPRSGAQAEHGVLVRLVDVRFHARVERARERRLKGGPVGAGPRTHDQLQPPEALVHQRRLGWHLRHAGDPVRREVDVDPAAGLHAEERPRCDADDRV